MFAGQRNDGFFVDLGSIFDLADLRPFQNLHLIPTAAAPGVDALATLNVHTIAIQVPIHKLTSGRHAAHRSGGGQAPCSGIWGAASRRKIGCATPPTTSAASPGHGCRCRAWAIRCSTK